MKKMNRYLAIFIIICATYCLSGCGFIGTNYVRDVMTEAECVDSHLFEEFTPIVRCKDYYYLLRIDSGVARIYRIDGTTMEEEQLVVALEADIVPASIKCYDDNIYVLVSEGEGRALYCLGEDGRSFEKKLAMGDVHNYIVEGNTVYANYKEAGTVRVWTFDNQESKIIIEDDRYQIDKIKLYNNGLFFRKIGKTDSTEVIISVWDKETEKVSYIVWGDICEYTIFPKCNYLMYVKNHKGIVTYDLSTGEQYGNFMNDYILGDVIPYGKKVPEKIRLGNSSARMAGTQEFALIYDGKMSNLSRGLKDNPKKQGSMSDSIVASFSRDIVEKILYMDDAWMIGEKSVEGKGTVYYCIEMKEAGVYGIKNSELWKEIKQEK